jgi:hypothetical protein
VAPSALDGPTGGYRNAPTSAPGVDFGAVLPAASWDTAAGGVISVDLAELGRAVMLFHDAAQAAGRAAGAAPRPVAGSAFGVAPWGGDPLGAAFGNQYAGPSEQLPEALESLRALLTGTADRLEAARDGFAAAEERATEEAVGLSKVIRGRD